MSIEDPNKYESVPVSKETVVDILKSKGSQSTEAVEILEKFTNETEARLLKEGRVDARSEALREKAHALNLAGCFVDAIEVMNEVARIAKTTQDTEGYEEAEWIIRTLINKSLLEVEANPSPESSTPIPYEKKMTLEESGERVSREEVVAAFKKLIGKVGDPADLDSQGPEVVEANKLFERWSVQGEQNSRGEDESSRHNFEKTMLFVAGFHHPEYLKDVLGWLLQDAENIPKDTENPTRIQLRKDMADAMRKIRELVGTIQS